MHVRGYTKHESSKTVFPGTYLGVAEKLDHLKVHSSFACSRFGVFFKMMSLRTDIFLTLFLIFHKLLLAPIGYQLNLREKMIALIV